MRPQRASCFFVVVMAVDVLFFLMDSYNPTKTFSAKPENLIKFLHYDTPSAETALTFSPSLMANMAHTRMHTRSLWSCL